MDDTKNVILRESTPQIGVPRIKKHSYANENEQSIIRETFRQAKTVCALVSEYPCSRVVPTIAGLMNGGRKDPD
jgi:hypothetical protein